MTGSGKENFIISLIYSMESTYAPQEVNFYILDFLSESLKMFKSSPYVGDVIYLSENEKILNFFKYISNEVQNRKSLFANFGGQYSSYIKNNPDKPLPNIVVFLNGFENFEENYLD